MVSVPGHLTRRYFQALPLTERLRSLKNTPEKSETYILKPLKRRCCLFGERFHSDLWILEMEPAQKVQ